MGRSRVELFEAIRRDHEAGGISIRGLADRHGVHRRTVRQALESASPPGRKRSSRQAPALDPVRALIDAMLAEDVQAPRKQRHTAKRVFDRLVGEHAVTSVSYSTVRAYVAVRRPQVYADAGGQPLAVTVGQLITTMRLVTKRSIPLALGTHASSANQVLDLRFEPTVSAADDGIPRMSLAAGAKLVYLDIIERLQRPGTTESMSR